LSPAHRPEKVGAVGRVVHFEIHADDSDRAERFYTSLNPG
jgi:predicted enzyme related to lactoylglutathione lyase